LLFVGCGVVIAAASLGVSGMYSWADSIYDLGVVPGDMDTSVQEALRRTFGAVTGGSATLGLLSVGADLAFDSNGNATAVLLTVGVGLPISIPVSGQIMATANVLIPF